MKPIKEVNEKKAAYDLRVATWMEEQAALPVEERDAEYTALVSGDEAPAAKLAEVKERMITFRPLVDHKCIIAGVPYILIKDEEIKLPEPIAIIFSNARKGFSLNAK